MNENEAALALISLTVWIVALVRRAAGQPFVPPNPRRDVPWRLVDVLLVLVAFLLFMEVAKAVVAALFGLPSLAVKTEREIDVASRLTPLLLVDGLTKLATIAFILFLAFVQRRATRADFGLTTRNVSNDIGLGVLGFLAALLPVYCVQAFMLEISPPERPHPVLQLLAEKSQIAAIVSAAFFAVVFAPLAEEFLFRAFLQGWLEAVLSPGPKSPPPIPSLPLAEVEPQVSLEAHAVQNLVVQNLVVQNLAVQNPVIENPYAPPQVDPTRAAGFIPAVAPPLHTPACPAWAAIVISSIVFAALHASEWPAPVPLFFLALILGYLYNRTHRLLPCIVVHLLFNGLSVAVVLSGVGRIE